VKDWNDAARAGVNIRALADKAEVWKSDRSERVGGLTPDPLADSISVTLASAVEPKPVQWLWKDRLALGKMTIFSGAPGVGKTMIECYVASIATSGGRWCTGELGPSCDVAMLTSEDGIADTIRPRLEAAGALLDGVHILGLVTEGKTKKQRMFSLQRDLNTLENMLEKHPGIKIIHIDPITAYMGDGAKRIDNHSTTDVRSVLSPFAMLAERRNVAVLAITHPPKASGGSAMHSAFIGSQGYIAQSRIGLFAAEEPDGEGRCVFLGVKNNLGPKASGRGYSIVTKQISNSIVAPYIVWDDAPVNLTADELIAAASSPGRNSKLNEAKVFLRGFLDAGPRPSEEVTARAKDLNIADKTLRRAADDIAKIERVGFGKDGRWVWRLA
jgi:putative DNA primase/helicase